MRLIRCRKCDTVISSSDTFLEQMLLSMEDCNKMAKNSNTYADKTLHIQRASQIKKMIVHTQALTYQLEERKVTVLSELSEIVHYLRANKLIDDDKLSELKDIGRKKAEIKNKNQQREIDKIYGNFENLFTNRTKADKTATNAIQRNAQ